MISIGRSSERLKGAGVIGEISVIGEIGEIGEIGVISEIGAINFLLHL